MHVDAACLQFLLVCIFSLMSCYTWLCPSNEISCHTPFFFFFFLACVGVAWISSFHLHRLCLISWSLFVMVRENFLLLSWGGCRQVNSCSKPTQHYQLLHWPKALCLLRDLQKLGIDKLDPLSLTDKEIRQFVKLDIDPFKVSVVCRS